MADPAMLGVSIGVPVLAALGSALATIFIRREFSPLVIPRVRETWVSAHEEGVILELEVENPSSVRVKKDTAVLRVREHDPRTGLDGCDAVCLGTEWVHLRSPSLHSPDEIGAHCSTGPCEVFTSTVFLNPKERIHVERLYQAGQTGMLHAALQFRILLPWWVRALGRLTVLFRLASEPARQWTTTRYVCRRPESPPPPPSDPLHTTPR